MERGAPLYIHPSINNVEVDGIDAFEIRVPYIGGYAYPGSSIVEPISKSEIRTKGL
jgi:hypothetical protein